MRPRTTGVNHECGGADGITGCRRRTHHRLELPICQRRHTGTEPTKLICSCGSAGAEMPAACASDGLGPADERTGHGGAVDAALRSHDAGTVVAWRVTAAMRWSPTTKGKSTRRGPHIVPDGDCDRLARHAVGRSAVVRYACGRGRVRAADRPL
jgi:hypothetical protein